MKIWNALSLALLLVTIVSLPLQGQKWNRQSISGTGGMVTKTLNIDNFDKVGVALNAKVILTSCVCRNLRVSGSLMTKWPPRKRLSVNIFRDIHL